jgi:hypothetical protein
MHPPAKQKGSTQILQHSQIKEVNKTEHPTTRVKRTSGSKTKEVVEKSPRSIFF